MGHNRGRVSVMVCSFSQQGPQAAFPLKSVTILPDDLTTISTTHG
jgi:hypothetical protein